MIAHELKRLRQRTGLSQEHFAALLGVTGMTVSRWERGQHRIDNLTAAGIRFTLMRWRKRKKKKKKDLTSDDS